MGDDELYEDFERDGEEVVRTYLVDGRYNARKAELAKEWIRRKDQRRKDASQSEHIEIARAAKDAAWAAARAAERAAVAAERANKRATIALIIAILSIIATTVMPFLQKYFLVP